ncbi:VOC family protein [Quadrisphaera setariae]|uniref:VOC family protein n=1 Tax=Quadrisphaera setariae TaxID=2593304 RepID=A0A5C8ZFU8_9ACTN|nr:VOC family protein [Quadrisphaera setariae]TXR56732.1 VOC family protein [Quadrisphaera setariae]
MPEMVTCLWFDGAAEEAARRYTELFPNSSVDAVVRSPADNPSVSEGAVLTVEFTLDGRRFLGLNGGPAFTPDEAVSIQVHTSDQAETDHYWDGLIADGGEESQCGWLKDPWGFSWQVVPKRLTELMADPDPDRARAAMQSMMTMQRIDVAELERAVAALPPSSS